MPEDRKLQGVTEPTADGKSSTAKHAQDRTKKGVRTELSTARHVLPGTSTDIRVCPSSLLSHWRVASEDVTTLIFNHGILCLQVPQARCVIHAGSHDPVIANRHRTDLALEAQEESLN